MLNSENKPTLSIVLTETARKPAGQWVVSQSPLSLCMSGLPRFPSPHPNLSA